MPSDAGSAEPTNGVGRHRLEAVGETVQKSLILILAREFASKLGTATFITDASGKLVYYNEPAESILGRTFGEAGEMPAEEWPSVFHVRFPDGRPMALEEM